MQPYSATKDQSESVSQPAMVLEVERLSKTFILHARGCVLKAVRDVYLKAYSGKFLTLIGASGSGKSTVLKCVHRNYRSSAGSIRYHKADGATIDLATASEAEILQLRRTEIRFVSQFFQALPRHTAEQVVMRPLLQLGEEREQARLKACMQLEQVGLPRRLWSVPPHTFSGGERQLVNLAQALVVRPRLLLLDEPTSSLDPRSTEFVVSAIEQLKELNIAIVAVLHDRRLVERLSDQILELSGGVDWQPAEMESTT